MKGKPQRVRINLPQAAHGVEHRPLGDQLCKDIVVAGKLWVAQLLDGAGDDPQVPAWGQWNLPGGKLPLFSQLDDGDRFLTVSLVHRIFERIRSLPADCAPCRCPSAT